MNTKTFLLLSLAIISSSCAKDTCAFRPLSFEEEIALSTKTTSQSDAPSSTSEAGVLFLLNQGKLQEAITLLARSKENNPYLFHTPILKQNGLKLLQEGMESDTLEDVQLALYGIALAKNEEALDLCKKAISSHQPQLQLQAIEVLKMYSSDESCKLLEDALKSDYLLIRLEAAYALATKYHTNAYGQIEALFTKVDPEFRPVFAELFTLTPQAESYKMLQRLLRDHDNSVRKNTLSCLAKMQRDEFSKEFSSLIQEKDPVIQEASCFAVGSLAHEGAIDLLEHAFQSGTIEVQLQAAYQLYKLGKEEKLVFIEEAAKNDNLFAIVLLGKLGMSKEVLVAKLTSKNLQVHLNASIALLEQKDPKATYGLLQLFIDSAKDLAFQTVVSPGETLLCYKATPSAEQNLKNTPFLFEVSLRLREEILVKALELPEEHFLKIAQHIFAHEQRDLIPITCRLLENLNSERAIQLLQKESEHPGSPFIRASCHLSLYRLHVPGTHEQELFSWISKHKSHNLIQLRPVLPWKMRQESSPYALSFEEESLLLVEAYETAAQSQNNNALMSLIEAIKDGNPHNRYLIAGLLISASE